MHPPEESEKPALQQFTLLFLLLWATVAQLAYSVFMIRAQSTASWTVWGVVLALDVVLPVSCLLTGFYIAFARPRDPLAWITLATLASFGQIAGSPDHWLMPGVWRGIFFVYEGLLHSAWPLWLLLFALYFPVPFASVQKHRWIAWMLAVIFAPVVLLGIYADAIQGRHLAAMRDVERAQREIGVGFAACVLTFLLLLWIKKRRLEPGDAQRRLNVMIAGSSIAAIPFFFYVAVSLGLLPKPPGWVTAGLLVLLLVFPLTLAYVIIVQRAMDVRMVVRSGVKYAFANTGIRTLRILLTVIVVSLTMQIALGSEHHWQAVAIGLIGATVVFGLRSIAMQVSEWTDRKFFREAYDAELVLTDLGNSLPGIRDVRTLVDRVAKRISESLHVEVVTLLVTQDDGYRPAVTLGHRTPVDVEFKRNWPTVRHLRLLQAPAKVYFDDPQSWVYGVPESEQKSLQALSAQILIPIMLNSEMMGIISLGPKRSEEPYSRGDLQLLSAVASQTGLALDNARLTENIRREVAARERLNRELEIAREVQQRLFPQTLPMVRGLDFGGYCRPALGVGGDYYDFIRLDDGSLGIAVGDVSGKGIAAALMMASLQASLRGQTIKPCAAVGEMIEHINRLVYEASRTIAMQPFFTHSTNQKRVVYGTSMQAITRRYSAGTATETARCCGWRRRNCHWPIRQRRLP